MIASHRSPHSILAAPALLASLPWLAGCAASDPPPDEALRAAFPERAAAVLGAGPGFIRRGGVLEQADAARRRGVAVSLPVAGSEAILFELEGGATLRVREVGAGGEAVLADRAVAYRRAGGSSFWTATPGGVEEWLLLDAEAVRRGAPVAAWEVEGGALSARGGAIDIADATGAALLRVTAPAAYAAGGRRVEPRIAARGARIELFVDAEGEQVLVDPAWQSPPPPAMGTGRTRHAAALLGSRVLVTGGTVASGISIRSAELYDPAAGEWSASPAPGDMRKARTEHTATALDGDRVLVVGGDADERSSTVEVYDARSGEWTLGASLLDHPGPLYRHTATKLATGAGDVLIVGGGADLDQAVIVDDVFRYDPTTGELTKAAPLGTPRLLHTATLLATGEVLVVGGFDGAALSSTELYDPERDTWRSGPSMGEGVERWMHTATRLRDGRVLVLGYSALTQIYDPVGNEFRSGEPMRRYAERHAHSATLLPSGCVLVAGGRLDRSTHYDDTELYDPDDDEWFEAALLTAARAFHEATYLDEDGSVIITGGEDRIQKLATVERFTLSQLGAPCLNRCECQSGFCVDGVCCDAACDGGDCDACSVAAGAPADGTCALLTGPSCDDKNSCTAGDACHEGTCVGTNDDTLHCDDKNPCTASDACHEGVCVGTNDDALPCDDGDRCTRNFCRGGRCTPEAITCPATDDCHVDGICNPESGVCVPQLKEHRALCEGDGQCFAGECVHPSPPEASSEGGAGKAEGAAGGGSGQPAEDGDGCGCRIAGAPAPGGGAAAALIMAAAACASRRRRQVPHPRRSRRSSPR
ncbi:kelch repeat-containing protein [Sorangium sp. So ce1000]|uniref:kelch repeat-containing protein n=1 Tax=Sorangium sp. So ce1000 TaxID=3133325 RepID=UPI003F5ED89B